MIEVEEVRSEQAILIGLCTGGQERRAAEESLLELRELALSASVAVVGSFLQERPRPDPAHLIGRGKLAQVRDAVFGLDADVVIFDEELSPAQLRNLEAFLEVKVIDRTELILDIFAQRAQSRAGKLQVELAQLEYLLPRLTGKGVALSRLGGGIGTRGPGETKLEVDRRRIRNRLARIRTDLEKLESQRELHRRRRRGIPIPTVSFVGYTNAGKSTLFNRLSGQKTFVSAKMFATLDPLVRKIELPSGQEILISDTVGFIRKLPHTLVAAFHATLEETLEADLILHVVDGAQPDFPALRQAVYEVLEEIGCDELPLLEVYNKMDLVEGPWVIQSGRSHVTVSALTGKGVEALLETIEQLLSLEYRTVTLKIPFAEGEILSAVRRRARIHATRYEQDGILIEVSLKPSDLARFRAYLNPARGEGSQTQGPLAGRRRKRKGDAHRSPAH